MIRIGIRRWSPAVLMMAAIFILSSRSSAQLPDFGSWDYFIKKGAHALGYGLLALAYWRGFEFERGKKPLTWVLAICYAITDEFHQRFVPGRHPALFDVLLFDNLGAILGPVLWETLDKVIRRRQS